jgi:hypothetical protein
VRQVTDSQGGLIFIVSAVRRPLLNETAAGHD